MIEIEIEQFKITVKGHSGYDEIGKDIVCAGVSTLAQTLRGELQMRLYTIIRRFLMQKVNLYRYENGNQRQFNKTANTAKDTAFNVIVVDRQNRKIHCFNYGAGIDREISY